jgi:hypothetical protein
MEWLEREKPNAMCICEFDDPNDPEKVSGTHWEINCRAGDFQAKSLREAIDGSVNLKPTNP